MPAHTEKHHSKYNTRQLFELVMDVESYPEFLPWCNGARITEKGGDFIIADLIIGFKGFNEIFTSRVGFENPLPEDENATRKVKVELVKGPFHHLNNHWLFAPAKDGGTDVSFTIDFKFRSMILEKMIGGVFDKALAKMAEAFDKRARELY